MIGQLDIATDPTTLILYGLIVLVVFLIVRYLRSDGGILSSSDRPVESIGGTKDKTWDLQVWCHERGLRFLSPLLKAATIGNGNSVQQAANDLYTALHDPEITEVWFDQMFKAQFKRRMRDPEDRDEIFSMIEDWKTKAETK